MPKEKRGLAATVIATTGVFGAVAAVLLYKIFNNWRVLYFIGGGMGLVLLLLRVTVAESGMYKSVQCSGVQKGNFLMFFNNKERFFRYMKGIFIGLPVWFTIGVLITFSDRFAKEFCVVNIEPGDAVLYQYLGLAFGDLCAGLLSNYLKSRKKALYIFYGVLILFSVLFFTQHGSSPQQFYFICAGLVLVQVFLCCTLLHQQSSSAPTSGHPPPYLLPIWYVGLRQ